MRVPTYYLNKFYNVIKSKIAIFIASIKKKGKMVVRKFLFGIGEIFLENRKYDRFDAPNQWFQFYLYFTVIVSLESIRIITKGD